MSVDSDKVGLVKSTADKVLFDAVCTNVNIILVRLLKSVLCCIRFIICFSIGMIEVFHFICM